jgi:hypothetical protein
MKFSVVVSQKVVEEAREFRVKRPSVSHTFLNGAQEFLLHIFHIYLPI